MRTAMGTPERRGRDESELGHFGPAREGAPPSRMVDVSAKDTTRREALARARVRFPAGVLARLLAEGGPKGALTEVARTAGVLAAKRTGELIPLCHPLGLDHVQIDFETSPEDPDVLEVRCRTQCSARTGVEMESLVGAALAALTVYDMTKGIEKGISIERLELLEKHGGKSGSWRRDTGSPGASSSPRPR